MRKEFDWEEFRGKRQIVVHCKTIKETIDFCEKMDYYGMRWCNGKSYLEENNFDYYKDGIGICYTGDGCFGAYLSCKSRGYKILEWSDYMKDIVRHWYNEMVY